jgi:hypothetical protein
MNNPDIGMPVAKASSAIVAAAATKSDVAEQVVAVVMPPSSGPDLILVLALPWATIAQMAAALYTVLLMGEWFWKKLWRPFLERRGWVEPIRHRIITIEEYDESVKGPP